MKLERYWIRFELEPFSSGPKPGCGVTAHNYDDALEILRRTIFKDKVLPPIQEVIEKVDISSLDQKHVIPNMEVPTRRGVWYPRGFTDIF
ncbi:hypothetical protein HDE76_000016 [Rhodanobacter sp. ANJX3]|uniref:hypothetical protein n=1 Tax=Rhodanobacter sp. ANJX3 TaxID=2723083 RepID=UPI00161928AA|nr:hypothetical protein [Rhodanobacter sp. ANJX3]MBB5356834.1 hypothetical protein [Rhodanobacter sp. ANJX3]